MKRIALAAAAGLFAPALAFAQGGGGVLNPVPAATIEARTPRHDTGSASIPRFDGRVLPFDNRTLPTRGNEAEVQTPNSLPRGAGPASGPMARRMDTARGETVEPGRLAPNNGSGISQTAASMPPGAMQGTLPQMGADQTARYQAAHKDRQLAALHGREAARLQARGSPGPAPVPNLP